MRQTAPGVVLALVVAGCSGGSPVDTRATGDCADCAAEGEKSAVLPEERGPRACEPGEQTVLAELAQGANALALGERTVYVLSRELLSAVDKLTGETNHLAYGLSGATSLAIGEHGVWVTIGGAQLDGPATGKVLRVPFDGGQPEELATDQGVPSWISARDGNVVWANEGSTWIPRGGDTSTGGDDGGLYGWIDGEVKPLQAADGCAVRGVGLLGDRVAWSWCYDLVVTDVRSGQTQPVFDGAERLGPLTVRGDDVYLFPTHAPALRWSEAGNVELLSEAPVERSAITAAADQVYLTRLDSVSRLVRGTGKEEQLYAQPGTGSWGAVTAVVADAHCAYFVGQGQLWKVAHAEVNDPAQVTVPDVVPDVPDWSIGLGGDVGLAGVGATSGGGAVAFGEFESLAFPGRVLVDSEPGAARLVALYDAAGVLQTLYQPTAVGSATISAAAPDPSDGTWVAGTFEEQIDWGDDVILTADGNAVFFAHLSQTEQAVPSAFALSATPLALSSFERNGPGRFSIAGKLDPAADGSDFVLGERRVPPSAEGRAFAAELSSSGDVVWVHTFGGVSGAVQTALAPEGQTLLAMGIRRALSMDGAELSPVSDGLALLQLDETGGVVWMNVVEKSEGGRISVNGLALREDGTIGIAGYLTGSIDFGGGVIREPVATAFLAGFSPAGEHVFSHGYSHNSGEGWTSLHVAGGAWLVTGSWSSEVQLGDIVLDPRYLGGAIAALDDEGRPRWVRQRPHKLFQLEVATDGNLLFWLDSEASLDHEDLGLTRFGFGTSRVARATLPADGSGL